MRKKKKNPLNWDDIVENKSTKKIADMRWEMSGGAWANHIDHFQYSQVQLDRRWEFRVMLRHDSLTPNLEIFIFSSWTVGKKSYLWEAFRQNRGRCGRICFCQRGGFSTCLCSICVSTQSQSRVLSICTWKTCVWNIICPYCTCISCA